MQKNKMHIDEIIDNLGYSNSENLIYFDQLSEYYATAHNKKIINKIQPYATFFLDNKPFIFFFDIQFNDINFKELSKEIWNAQIPITIFCDNEYVYIYNGMSINLKNLTLIKAEEIPINECSFTSNFSFFQISDPFFWETFSKKYSDKKINHWLLENISYITSELKNTFKLKFATKLVLRLIFIRFLIDRGVDLNYKGFNSDINDSRNELLKCLKNKNDLYDLFYYLKEKFNGNLFDLTEEKNDPNLQQPVFNLLYDFIEGTVYLKNGQCSFFALYDFNIIPVELISSIYEILLEREKKSVSNAFYTPNFLVEYILNSTTVGVLRKNLKYSILDPACGSGVFLVDSLRRIIEINLKNQDYCNDDNFLTDLLTKNIFGIDIDNEAIDITIFSLYLTLLDYKDPKSLSSFKLPNLLNTNLFVSDFFDEQKLESLQNKNFDFIIGNPPWGYTKTNKHIDYCKKNNLLDKISNKEICQSFVLRSKDFCSKKTTCCFLLHSKILYNKKGPSKNFRSYILDNTKILNIVELSSVRKLIFKQATAPAVIMTYKHIKTEQKNYLNNIIKYISIKPNIFFKLFNLIVIEKNDIKYISQNFLYENDWAWKTIVYGFAQDLENIKYLQKNFITLEEALNKQTPKIKKGVGLEIKKGEMDASHLINKRILKSKNSVNHFFVNSNNTVTFREPFIHRTRGRDTTLFEAPFILTPTGVDCSNYKIKAALSDKSFLTQKTMYIIKGETSQIAMLSNITGLLNSSFYAYLNLMIGSSIGIEREERQTKEILKYPYAYTDEIAQLSIEIKELKESNFFNFNNSEIKKNIEKLDNLVLDFFNLKTNNFIDYALNIQIPELTTSNPEKSYRKVNETELRDYSIIFKEQFSTIYNPIGKYIKINVYKNVLNKFSIFELFILDEKGKNSITIYEKMKNEQDIKVLTKFSIFSINEKFYNQKDIIHFNTNSFFILKPNFYKYWHPAVAELDLSNIIDQIMTTKGNIIE